MRGRRALVAGLALAVCGGCGVPAQDRARAADDASVPFGLLDEHAPPIVVSPTAGAREPVSVCFVDGDRLAVVSLSLQRPVSLDDVVAALAQPPTDGRAALRTAVGDPTIVHSVRLDAGTAHVDLVAGVNDLGPDDQLLAFAQLVCTLTARPGIGQVSFTLSGAPVEVPRGDGSLTDEPVSRDDYAALVG